ncbi:unnamed protein product [Lepidochelys kempii]
MDAALICYRNACVPRRVPGHCVYLAIWGACCAVQQKPLLDTGFLLLLPWEEEASSFRARLEPHKEPHSGSSGPLEQVPAPPLQICVTTCGTVHHHHAPAGSEARAV